MDYIKIEATDLTYVLGNIDKIKEDLDYFMNTHKVGVPFAS